MFLLDEFETVTLAESLNADFFSHLRSLAVGRYIGLVFVTSSRQRLSELSHAGIVGSPFFNISSKRTTSRHSMMRPRRG